MLPTQRRLLCLSMVFDKANKTDLLPNNVELGWRYWTDLDLGPLGYTTEPVPAPRRSFGRG